VRERRYTPILPLQGRLRASMTFEYPNVDFQNFLVPRKFENRACWCYAPNPICEFLMKFSAIERLMPFSVLPYGKTKKPPKRLEKMQVDEHYELSLETTDVPIWYPFIK
jgi:hypothetical protein